MLAWSCYVLGLIFIWLLGQCGTRILSGPGVKSRVRLQLMRERLLGVKSIERVLGTRSCLVGAGFHD